KGIALEHGTDDLDRNSLLTRERQRADRTIAERRATRGDVGDRIDVRAARIERHIEADRGEISLIDAGEVSTVLSTLDPGQLEAERRRGERARTFEREATGQRRRSASQPQAARKQGPATHRRGKRLHRRNSL